MIFFKVFLKITGYLFLSFTVGIIEWVPSIMIENIVNSLIIILYIFPVFFIYKSMRTFHQDQKNKGLYKSAGYAALLLSYMGLFAILSIGVAYDKSVFIKSYVFGDTIFYVYQNVDTSYELSVKDEFLPIRSLPIASLYKSVMTLESDKKYVYAVSDEVLVEVYDLEKNIPIKTTKENDEHN